MSTAVFPIESLPEEIFAETLLWWTCLDEDAPWLATVVSHRWRSTALSYSKLWSRVTVRYPREQQQQDDLESSEEEHGESANPRGERHPLALWLARSGDSNLYVSIHVDHIAPLVSTLNAMVTCLRAQASRLKELEMCVYSSRLADMFLSMLWEKAPSLMYISISCGRGYFNSDSEDTLLSLWHTLEGAPSVKSLRCGGCLPPRMIAGLSSPARLSTLVLDNLVSHRLEILLDSLEACSSLISLTIANASIENFRPRYPKVPLERLIVLPALTSLTVHRYHSYNPGELLPHLFTPKLASLALREFMPYALMDILARGGLGAEIVRKRMGLLGGVLETFFGRGTEIKEFFWECSPTTDESFLRVLNHLPGLSILHLKKSLIDRLAITGLSRVNTTCNDNTTPLCPKLQVLTFDSCPLIDSDSLYELLCSRSTSASSLSITTMDISRCELVKEAHVQKLRTVDPERSTISFSPCT